MDYIRGVPISVINATDALREAIESLLRSSTFPPDYQTLVSRYNFMVERLAGYHPQFTECKTIDWEIENVQQD